MEAVVEWSPRCVSADVPGAAFLLQKELQWFKALEDRSDPSFKTLKFKVLENRGDPLKLVETKKRGGKTYWEIFLEQRQDLLKEAGEWMKNTSSSCSLIATLIIAVAIAAAFTVPGGYDNSTGIPIFLKKDSFMIFAFADALALFSSVTATVMFLAIVTPCYTFEDVLHSLPRKMIMGITSLFLSLAFTLVAFSSALTIILSERFKWIYILMALLAAIPVCFFLCVQSPLYVEMVKSIYWPRLYHPLKPRKKRGWDFFNFSPKFFRTKAS
ncbi:ankyrin repeat-containing protein ITN1-like [Eucalyptus grandis]|uniref:ankyrin repeat-containing protein ITN1-like n=1 Tax=Eucalyptus grandis TaxID=71139 RepID=UPI00192EFE04|nr:ankyrin repeat-containing protein ITN1-like [Eucalyptus grandis]